MLIYTDELHIIPRQQLLGLSAEPGIDAELRLVPRRHNLLTVACADAGIETEGDAPATVYPPEGLQLREIGADEYPLSIITQFVGGDIVADIKISSLPKPACSRRKNLAVDIACPPLILTDDAEQGQIGIRLDGKTGESRPSKASSSSRHLCLNISSL